VVVGVVFAHVISSCGCGNVEMKPTLLPPDTPA
jgi:hypothetical protein